MFTYSKTDHVYRAHGRVVPSVTGVIAAGGLLAKSSPFYTAESRERGTRIHDACLAVDVGTHDDDAMRVLDLGYITSYRRWLSMFAVQWTWLEVPRYSAAYGFGGTADRVGTLNGHPVVVDMKTGGAEPWHRFQLALYDLLYDDVPPRIRRRISLYLRPDGGCAQTVEYRDLTDYDRALHLIKPQRLTATEG